MFNMNNFGQLDPNSISAVMNPNSAPGMQTPGIGGLGQVPGFGQVPGMEMKGAPSSAGGEAMDRYASSMTMNGGAGGGNQMAQIMGMEALKGIQAGANDANKGKQLSSPAPVAPRGGKVELEEVNKNKPVDPRLYMMLAGGGLGK